MEIQREKVRCSVPDPDLQMERGGGGAGGLVPGPQFSLKIRAPPLDPKLGISFKFKNLKTALPSGHTTMDQDQLWHI